MSIYLGSTKVMAQPVDVSAWWGGKNPVLLHEANYNCTLNQTSDWPTYFEAGGSTTSRTIKFAPTTVTTEAHANVIYDRYTGDTLNFEKYDYFVLIDAILNVEYDVENEATMGITHTINTVRTSLFPFFKNIAISANTVKFPGVDGFIGTSTSSHLSWTYTLTRNASNNLVLQSGAYGFQFTGIAPAINTTTAWTSTQIDFKTPTLIVRNNNSYLTNASFVLIDGDASIIKIRQRLYQVSKQNLPNAVYTRIGQMILTGNFPTEAF